MDQGTIDDAQGLLARAAACGSDDTQLSALSVELAECLFRLSETRITSAERARQARIRGMLADPAGQLFSILLADRVAHDRSGRRSVEQLDYLLERLGAPEFMSAGERRLLAIARGVGRLAPRLTSSLMLRRIRREVEGLVFSIEPARLRRLLEQRRSEGVQVNVNHLGEEVLGEVEAERRVAQYCALLARPEIETVSVKLSAIFSQIDVWAWERSLEVLTERLGRIYRAALAHPVERDGASRSKLVYLDMEAYRDLYLSLELFMRLLDQPEFRDLSAGLVLQAYVPDAGLLQQRALAWARERARRGGAPLRLRIVKGANLAHERVRAALTGWPLPIYPSKAEVDASYKRLLYAGTEPDALAHFELGIASHNVFDIALGLVLRAARGAGDRVEFELLEGMANGLRRTLSQLGARVLVYAPAVEDDALNSAVAYLVRRLDENTAPENFLRHAFSMQVGDPVWREHVAGFTAAHAAREHVSLEPRARADRFAAIVDLDPSAPFENEPDTDLSVAENRAHVRAALEQLGSSPPWSFSSVISGSVGRGDGADEVLADGFDPSRPGVVPYRYALASRAELEAAVAGAVRARGELDEVPLERRAQWVRAVASGLRRRRAELIAAMVLDCGKRVNEADAEVSEAIDFAEYYVRCAEAHAAEAFVERKPKGVVLVASPWNFPLAIPLSGVLAALIAGNAVLFKPPLETPFVGEQLASVVWQAGVPSSILQLLLCRDEEASLLIEHPDVDLVVLTGATSTARRFLEQRPGLDLAAETGGKNAFIVSSIADRELAIKDLVASAFGHAGQKCSAASLAILHRDVYDDPRFREQLADAARSLAVGSAWDPKSVVTPLIRPPEGPLARALRELHPGESWLLEPRIAAENERLCSPGIKLGVQPGSFMHQTELFGPVLGLMRARDFEHALALANGTPYGLVAGLHSLDEREQRLFVEKIRCGNVYVNRKITGAIVGRQPFGGHKASNVGPGAKAGGPNYVLLFQELADPPRLPQAAREGGDGAPRSTRASDTTLERRRALEPLVDWVRARANAQDAALFAASLDSYVRWQGAHFGREHRDFELLGEENVFRYQPCESLIVHGAPRARAVDLARACAAAVVSGVRFELGLDPELADQLADVRALEEACGVRSRVWSAQELATELGARPRERLRWVGDGARKPPDVVLHAARSTLCHVADRRVLWHGRYELLRYHREQAISIEYHRYGHLGFRTLHPMESPGRQRNAEPVRGEAAAAPRSELRPEPAGESA